jgi:hypothetical protein
MDGALKRDAVVAEVTLGTTPATPAFKTLRTISIDGDPDRPASRSPERSPTGQATNMYDGNATYRKTFNMPWQRDAGLDLLWSSLVFAPFATDILKNGTTANGFTLEEKYSSGTGSDVYRRISGMQCGSASIAFANDGQPGRVTFNAQGRAETNDTAAIAGATYSSPAPGNDPNTAADITATNIFGVATPELANLNLSIDNSLSERYGFGSRNPTRQNRGWLQVQGSVEMYFGAATQYSTFATRQLGLALDITIGTVTLFKDQLQLPKCDVWNPKVRDPGPTGDNSVMLNFLAKYSATDACTLILTRNVA